MFRRPGADRRGARRATAQLRAPVDYDALVLATAPKAWVRPDRDVTVVSSKVTSISNANGAAGGTFDQANSGNQMPEPAVSAAFGGQLVFKCNGASYYDTSLPNGSFDLHLGPFYIVAPLKLNATGIQVVAAEGNTLARSQYTVAGTDTVGMLINNNVPVSIVNVQEAGVLDTTTPKIVAWSFDSTDWEIRAGGVSVASGTASGSPAGSANSPFRIFGLTNGGVPLNADVGELLVYDRIPSAGDLATLTAYFADRYAGLVGP